MLYSFLITIVILVIQFFLSRRNNVYLGAILPVVYLVTLIYLWFSETLFIKSTLLAAFAGLAALLGSWINGRESLKKK